MRRTILTALGIFNVALGTAGIFLPLLPTTPFLLLAAYLFARSDPRLHGWLLSHPRLGPYISAFRNRNGLTRTQKLRIGSSLTIVMAFSTYVAPVPGVKVFLGGIWLFWMVMLLRMKTLQTVNLSPPPSVEVTG
ncbi:MAG: YbaN family protein [Planctomycetota bacterium]